MKLNGAEVCNIYNVCSKIGGESNASFRVNIPHYQRPYKWTTNEIENLFEDFFQNFNDDKNDPDYFIGSVVLVKDDDKQKAKDFYNVIDGQQRITTVYLLNYLKFLLNRSYAEELILLQKNSTVADVLRAICDEMRMIFAMSQEEIASLEEACDRLKEKIDELNKMLPDEKDVALDTILSEYRREFGLPQTKDLAKSDIYLDLLHDSMSTFINGKALALRYDRKAYNDVLKDVLCNYCIMFSNNYKPQLLTIEHDENDAIHPYLNALETQFTLLDYLCDKKIPNATPIERVKLMVSNISEMLSHLSFCKILTSNENDAYTLFEVLNDRALKVDDLELVKNMFFRKYCTASVDSEPQKDLTIEKLDELWGNSIFPPNKSASATFVAYNTAVFLTGDNTLVANKGQRFKEFLEKNYLYKIKSYDSKQIEKDFTFFHMMRLIVDVFDIKFSGQAKNAVMAENNHSVSEVYKAVCLIHALGYVAVMPAITCIIVSKYMSLYGDEKFSESKFTNFLNELKNGQNQDMYKDVYSCAFDLKKTVLLAADYQIPREFAKRVIENNNVSITNACSAQLSAQEANKLQNQFIDWTKRWRYGSEKANLRLKIMFIDLYKTEKNGNKLEFKGAQYTLSNNDQVALDHLDAQKKDSAATEKYFEPSKGSTDKREDYINAIGNMMILDGKNNKDKNNKPLFKALDYHKKLANHWLVQEIEEMLNDDNYSISISSDDCKVPNENFFKERQRRLQMYFYAVINRMPDTTEVEIKDIF